MDERLRPNDVPESRISPVAKDFTQRFAYSQKQLASIQESAIQYLKRNNLPFSADSFTRAQAVVGIDCIERALLVVGREEISEKDNVVPLIKKGLELREAERVHGREAIEPLTSELRGGTEAYLGPYAFPQEVARLAEGELKTFLLAPSIRNIEEISRLYLTRRSLLPQLAANVLAMTAERFPQAQIDKFSTDIDQAKLVRNSIVSAAYRQNPIPVIQVEEIRNFISDNEGFSRLVEMPFLGDLLPSEIEKYGDIREAYVKYLLDLSGQAQQALLTSQSISDQQIILERARIAFRDQLFHRFSSVFLLMHPALEETPFITHPDRAIDTDYSLWREDLSVVIGASRVPTVASLQRAVRLREAQGYASGRFEQGIEAWYTYGKSVDREKHRVSVLQKHTETTGASIALARDIQSPLPESAYELIRESAIASEYFLTRARLRKYRQLLGWADAMKNQVQNYFQGAQDGKENADGKFTRTHCLE